MEVQRSIDWTGVAPPVEPIEPLTPETFVARLNALSAEVNSLARLERAFVDQNPRYVRRTNVVGPTTPEHKRDRISHAP
jgi:hypothetical protein